MKKLLVLPALFLAANTWASCPASMPQEAPAVPNGVEAYLGCRSASLHPLVHNRAVYLAETAAESWNTALHSFRQRENMLATN